MYHSKQSSYYYIEKKGPVKVFEMRVSPTQGCLPEGPHVVRIHGVVGKTLSIWLEPSRLKL